MAKAEKKETKMLELKITKLTPKQKVMNLDNNEETEIVVASERFELPPYDEAEHGTPDEYEEAAFIAAEKLVQPRAKQIDALLYRATQDSYQAGKAAALATGNYLTSDLRKRIVAIMSMMNAYSELGASECYKKWLAGYKEQKPGAIKLLKMAQDTSDEVDDL